MGGGAAMRRGVDERLDLRAADQERRRDPGEEGVFELPLGADEREDRAVVVGVRVDVEHLGVGGESGLDRRDRAAIPPLREVRDGLERQLHGPYSRFPL